MSNLLRKIKEAQLEARKAKHSVATGVLTSLISEAEMVGKNDGNRPSTDLEVIATIKKMISTTKETLELITDKGSAAYLKATMELSILETHLPRQYSTHELLAYIEGIILVLEKMAALSKKDVGKVMAELKAQHAGLYDAKVASDIIKQKLGAQV